MINDILSNWIAESESWQTFIDFKHPNSDIGSLAFFNRPDDFYISLFGEMYEILENIDERKNDILSIAKGLEIFSLKNKAENFFGVNQPNNILFAAGLYYLADFSSSAYILANLFDSANYENDIDKFLICFLKRKIDTNNIYCSRLKDFLNTGDQEIIIELLAIVKNDKDKAYKDNPVEFASFLLAETILNKFQNNNIWTDLLRYDSIEHWQPYVEKSLKKPLPVWDFFPSQKLALQKGILSPFNSLALQTPTSSGKTAICELIIYNEVKNNFFPKILYLAPYRALASELKNSFGRNLNALGIKSKTIYGGNIPTIAERDLIENITLLISTPEKFMALENTIPNFLSDFTMIICDEGHLLDDTNRGLSYELLLSRLKNQSGSKKFVFISAIVPNINSINSWLGGSTETVVESKYRATDIEYGFLKPNEEEGTGYYLDVNPFNNIPKNYRLNNFLTPSDFKYIDTNLKTPKEKIYDYTSDKKLTCAIALRALESGTVALFNPAKGKKAGVISQANEIMKMLDMGLEFPKPIDYVKGDSTINDLADYFSVIFGNDFSLVSFVRYGALYHHGDLPQYVREIIEDSIRRERIRLIVCTNTIAEGVNLPIRNIIVYSTRRYDEEEKKKVPLKLRNLKNLFGRAGRAGKETKGLVIAVNKYDFGRIEKVINNNEIEDVKGQLFSIVEEISEVINRKRLILTNEILEAQDESFKSLIDSIDISIIDLLGEEVNPEELNDVVQTLINDTFAKFQSNINQSNTLNSLISLRGENIKPYIEDGNFKYIKQSGINIRNFKEVIQIIDLDDEIWTSIENPLDQRWLDFIFNKVASLSTIQNKLSEFNRLNKTDLTIDNVKEATILWIEGKWFHEISHICLNDVDITLRLINSFVCYHIQSIVTAIIRNAELRLEENGVLISQTIIDFPQYLLYGFRKPIQLALVEIGFSERMGIIELSKILEEDNYYTEDLNLFKEYLTNNRADIYDRVKIPNIAHYQLRESFSYLPFY